jgi:hypothetical protein
MAQVTGAGESVLPQGAGMQVRVRFVVVGDAAVELLAWYAMLARCGECCEGLSRGRAAFTPQRSQMPIRDSFRRALGPPLLFAVFIRGGGAFVGTERCCVGVCEWVFVCLCVRVCACVCVWCVLAAPAPAATQQRRSPCRQPWQLWAL